MNNKHLTFEERSIIEDLLNKGEKIHKIAQKLGKPDSSIVREVQRNRYVCHTATKEKCEFQFGAGACTVINLVNADICLVAVAMTTVTAINALNISHTFALSY